MPLRMALSWSMNMGGSVYLNQAVVHLLNWRTEEVEGQPIRDLLPELDWDSLTSFGPNGRQRTTRHEFEVTYPRARFLRLYAAPLDAEARGDSGMALIINDATEARQKTFEAIESERIHSLTLLAASVAHEIGNPLNALHIHLQLMARQIKKLRTAGTGRHSCRGPIFAEGNQAGSRSGGGGGQVGTLPGSSER